MNKKVKGQSTYLWTEIAWTKYCMDLKTSDNMFLE